MPPPSDQIFQDALSFLAPELRNALGEAPDGSTCATLPMRDVALLWCDISGFSDHTHALLSKDGADGVDHLHQQIDGHYGQLLGTILKHGGEPVTFVGDGLMSVWPAAPGDMAAAIAAAANAACDLMELQRDGQTVFRLNQHLSCGTLQTVQLGGRDDRWLTTSVGSALRELAQIAQIKDPGNIILTNTAAGHLPQEIVRQQSEATEAFVLTGRPDMTPTEQPPFTIPSKEAWQATVDRLPRFAAGWIETVGLKFLADLRPVTATSISIHDVDTSDPDSVVNLNAVVRAIQTIVHERDGYVAEVIVDEKGLSVLVTFGAPPDAHSDDPQRSVYSAHDISVELDRINVKASIGVATGRMLCCIVGTPDRRCDLVLGDAVIRATRLAAATERGVLVDEATMRASAGSVTYAVEPQVLLLKGSDTATQAWPVAGLSMPDAHASATAGRQKEIALLQQRWSNAQSGLYGTNVVIEGDSGLGKTCLALDLRHYVATRGGQFSMSSVSAVSKDAPLSALRRPIMDVLGVSPVMLAEKRKAAILAALPYHLHDHAPLLNALFPTGLEETEFTLDLRGRARATRIQNLIIDVMIHAASEVPWCICIDDAQWLGEEARAILARLAEMATGLMVVILAQPTPETDWADYAQMSGFAHIPLGPLSAEGMTALVCDQLGCDTLHPDLFRQLAEKTGNHPFYGAEVVRSLHEAGGIRIEDGRAELLNPGALTAAAIPDTLHGMVLQRLDKLLPKEQVSLRVASVGGLVFPTQMVCDIHPLRGPSQEVRSHLDNQVQNGFLLRRVEESMPGYAFTNGLVCDVAHSQLPRQQSCQLHASAAEWIEVHAGTDRDSKLLELAHHWSEAGQPNRAVPYLLEEALRLFSQGFAEDAVQVGLRAMRLHGIVLPDDPAQVQQQIGENLAKIERLAAGRSPLEIIDTLKPPRPEVGLQLQSILTTAPFAFQSNQFEVFAWAATVAMCATLETDAAVPDAISTFSIVQTLLTGDRAAGAAWSGAALELDKRTGGSALPTVGFIDTWFHSHWRAPLEHSVEINRAAAARAIADNDRQFASYNIAGGVILASALGQPLEDVIMRGRQALVHSLHRNARMHVHLEIQFAKALQGETRALTDLSDDIVDEMAEIGWVTETEFANQIAFYIATKARLHRHAGDWQGALDWYGKLAPVRPAIGSQLVECDVVLHCALAHCSRVLAGAATVSDTQSVMDDHLGQLSAWGAVRPDNFGVKAKIAMLVWQGLEGDATSAQALTHLAQGMEASNWLQDRAVALEFAARLDPTEERRAAAVAAHTDWGAYGVAEALRTAEL